MLDTLFEKLKTATDPFAIQSLEQGIWEQWTMVPDAGQRELMFRGIAEMSQQELQSAAATFTRLIISLAKANVRSACACSRPMPRERR